MKVIKGGKISFKTLRVLEKRLASDKGSAGLPLKTVKKLEAFGFAVEAHPSKPDRYKLIYRKTNMTVGVKGHIWTSEELEKLAEVREGEVWTNTKCRRRGIPSS